MPLRKISYEKGWEDVRKAYDELDRQEIECQDINSKINSDGSETQLDEDDQRETSVALDNGIHWSQISENTKRIL